MKLNVKQSKAYDLVLSGENVCITGEAGTGKSVIVNKIRENMASETVFLSPTGIAAINIGGVTVHSAFGAPLGLPTIKEMKSLTKRTKTIFKSDQITRIVIDEVYMVRPDLLDYIDNQLKMVKSNRKPFGGLQVVFVGDPLQLKSFIKDKSKEAKLFYQRYTSLFPFTAPIWERCKLHTVLLTEPMRQDSVGYLKALDSIRKGDHNVARSVSWINWKASQNDVGDAIVLATTNKTVDTTNETMYQRQKGAVFTNKARLSGAMKKADVLAPVELKLKEGCRVIILANNHEEGYANGMTGVFTGHGMRTTESTKGVVKEQVLYVDIDPCGGSVGYSVEVPVNVWTKQDYVEHTGGFTKEDVGTFTQFPVKLGYAISIHKSQGMTLDKARVNLGWGAFTEAQTYIALSRLRSLDGLSLINDIKLSDIKVCPEALAYYEQLLEEKEV